MTLFTGSGSQAQGRFEASWLALQTQVLLTLTTRKVSDAAMIQHVHSVLGPQTTRSSCTPEQHPKQSQKSPPLLHEQ